MNRIWRDNPGSMNHRKVGPAVGNGGQFMGKVRGLGTCVNFYNEKKKSEI